MIDRDGSHWNGMPRHSQNVGSFHLQFAREAEMSWLQAGGEPHLAARAMFAFHMANIKASRAERLFSVTGQ